MAFRTLNDGNYGIFLIMGKPTVVTQKPKPYDAGEPEAKVRPAASTMGPVPELRLSKPQVTQA